MAYKEVVDEGGGAGGEFYTFDAIGQKLEGYFASTAESRGQFAKPGDLIYRVFTKDGMKVVDPKTDLRRKLVKATNAGQLAPGVKMMITYASDLDVGQASKMKVFKVLIDVDDAGKPIVNPKALAAIKAYVPPKPEPKPDPGDPFGDAGGDDIPF